MAGKLGKEALHELKEKINPKQAQDDLIIEILNTATSDVLPWQEKFTRIKEKYVIIKKKKEPKMDSKIIQKREV